MAPLLLRVRAMAGEDSSIPSIARAQASTPLELEEELAMVLLSRAELRILLDRVERVDRIEGGELDDPGAGGTPATLRWKLRTAAPVRDARFQGVRRPWLRRLLRELFPADGRERGRCRWCERRGRVDEFGLCEACAPSRPPPRTAGP